MLFLVFSSYICYNNLVSGSDLLINLFIFKGYILLD